MRPVPFRREIMRVLRNNHDGRYWISTAMINEELENDCIDSTAIRVGTNLNILQRRGYVRRLNQLPVWRLTEKGLTCDYNNLLV